MTPQSEGVNDRSIITPLLKANRTDHIFLWLVRGVALIGVVTTVWAAIATGSMLVHGHPAYAILLALTCGVSAVIGLRAWLHQQTRHRRFPVLRGALIVAALTVIAICAWLVPSSATQPALAAMQSDATVTVTEAPDHVLMTPTSEPSGLGVFFQPGARVDARAYAAILRPLAEDGHTVYIAKQPLGIAFLSVSTFGSIRSHVQSVTHWIVAGHSLGGTVASLNASSDSDASTEPAVGLMLYASYPASDIHAIDVRVLSISGSNDGLATQEKIDASVPNLPQGATFTVIDGGVHSFFGDYGPQAGDGTPTITQDSARREISKASVVFVRSLIP